MEKEGKETLSRQSSRFMKDHQLQAYVLSGISFLAICFGGVIGYFSSLSRQGKVNAKELANGEMPPAVVTPEMRHNAARLVMKTFIAGTVFCLVAGFGTAYALAKILGVKSFKDFGAIMKRKIETGEFHAPPSDSNDDGNITSFFEDPPPNNRPKDVNMKKGEK